MKTGADLRDIGMQLSLDFADRAVSNWSEDAYQLLCTYARSRSNFMVEEVRQFAKKSGLPDPPSLRAWGSIAARAAREGVITRVGFRQVSNPSAHCTPAAVWQAI